MVGYCLSVVILVDYKMLNSMTMESTEDKQQLFFRFLNLFTDISEDDFAIIKEYFHVDQFPAGKVLLHEAETAKQLFFVLKGILKIVSVSEKGNEVIHFFVKENKFCTILYSFQRGDTSSEGIVCATDVELIVFSKQGLEKLYTRLPYFESLMQNITQQTLLDKIRIRNSYMGEDATARYLKFITQNPDIMLRVPLSDVASYLGITQQSLSRIRREITF